MTKIQLDKRNKNIVSNELPIWMDKEGKTRLGHIHWNFFGRFKILEYK